ncbi:hypothetical protein Afil01_62410 [Actinorhabdospora filicis]|uniref:Exonuclease n=1 Tax=Actinorhabdospora filicis TaxID=1785913 RepID=A0A9W6SR68_9ACTN|nr:hypothetical protein [Actinorhabdospora filicis]GLZ81434.1 hypothetical protein Afil01_62410 [Actinorhabdospora filicis]
MSDELLQDLLATPTAPAVPRRDPPSGWTARLMIRADAATAELRRPAADAEPGEDAARRLLAEKGLSPESWQLTGLRTAEWTMADGTLGESVRCQFRRVDRGPDRPDVAELAALITPHAPVPVRPHGEFGFLVLLGDMQLGKVDGDGAGGTVARTIGCINEAADLLETYRQRFDIGHVHIGLLGDHIEGFTSQAGAQAWRTGLTLTEQLRLTRRLVLHAVTTFAPLAERVSVAAVPGNHGEPQRFGRAGITRYDDNHDTDTVMAVAEATAQNPAAYGHVEYHLPERDELTVVTAVAGTVIAHAHGHQWRPNQHFAWWKGQAFNADSPMHHADLLVAGHYHGFRIDSDGPRRFVQVPALEAESTWWRHKQGSTGDPGLIVAVTRNGRLHQIESVHIEQQGDDHDYR